MPCSFRYLSTRAQVCRNPSLASKNGQWALDLSSPLCIAKDLLGRKVATVRRWLVCILRLPLARSCLYNQVHHLNTDDGGSCVLFFFFFLLTPCDWRLHHWYHRVVFVDCNGAPTRLLNVSCYHDASCNGFVSPLYSRGGPGVHVP